MNKDIGLVTCSNSCIDYFVHDYDIRVFRSTLYLDDEEYLDYTEIKTDEFYERLENNPELFPRSSYYPLGKMIETYENLKKEGYKKILVVTISKEMSGIYNAAQLAAANVEGVEVHVFDSKSVSYPEAKMVLRAAEMIEEGKGLDEILNELAHIRTNNKTYFAVKTLDYLVKNGRLSSTSGFIGKHLKIKPLLTIDKYGEIKTVEKIRTFKKALDKVVFKFLEETEGREVEAYIMHANNYESRDYIEQKILKARPDIKEVISLPLTPVIGAHSGPKAIGLGYYIKD
ncbi:MAG: DegV family protein [Candidatus Izimaplasma sp.]|nr:DegV family protein [Candidatus Izimaplasma bacterium]